MKAAWDSFRAALRYGFFRIGGSYGFAVGTREGDEVSGFYVRDKEREGARGDGEWWVVYGAMVQWRLWLS